MVHQFNFAFPPLLANARIENKYVREGGAFQHNTVLVSGRLISDGLPYGGEVKADAEMGFCIVFDERTPLVGGWLVAGTLDNMADRAGDCITKTASDILGITFTVD